MSEKEIGDFVQVVRFIVDGRVLSAPAERLRQDLQIHLCCLRVPQQ